MDRRSAGQVWHPLTSEDTDCRHKGELKCWEAEPPMRDTLVLSMWMRDVDIFRHLWVLSKPATNDQRYTSIIQCPITISGGLCEVRMVSSKPNMSCYCLRLSLRPSSQRRLVPY